MLRAYIMKTIEIEVELMRYLNIRQTLIVPNIYWGMGLNYECDIVKLSSSNYATEIEIKVSRQDLLKDKDKNHNHFSNLFKFLYFAVPEKLQELALKEIPIRAGLFIVGKNKYDRLFVREIRKPLLNKTCRQWTKEERYKLAELGSMRILGLKKKIVSGMRTVERLKNKVRE